MAEMTPFDPSIRFLKAHLTGSPFVFVDYGKNEITFRLQNGPIMTRGQNGCDIMDVVDVATLILQHFDRGLPCRENAIAITKLQEAGMWLRKRWEDRCRRKVEGTEQP